MDPFHKHNMRISEKKKKKGKENSVHASPREKMEILARGKFWWKYNMAGQLFSLLSMHPNVDFHLGMEKVRWAWICIERVEYLIGLYKYCEEERSSYIGHWVGIKSRSIQVIGNCPI